MILKKNPRSSFQTKITIPYSMITGWKEKNKCAFLAQALGSMLSTNISDAGKYKKEILFIIPVADISLENLMTLFNLIKEFKIEPSKIYLSNYSSQENERISIFVLKNFSQAVIHDNNSCMEILYGNRGLTEFNEGDFRKSAYTLKILIEKILTIGKFNQNIDKAIKSYCNYINNVYEDRIKNQYSKRFANELDLIDYR